jgi:prolyl 4-hydroxylase
MLPELIERANVLAPSECSRLIAYAEPLVQPSIVTGMSTPHSARTSWEVRPESIDSLLEPAERLEATLANVTGTPISHRETWRLIRYRPGELYRAHFDWFSGAYPEALERGGQRTWSIVIYLNDIDDGGATVFPSLRRSIRPERGKLLAWHNLDAEGKPLRSALHSGHPPRAGTKWILSTWYRQGPHQAR